MKRVGLGLAIASLLMPGPAWAGGTISLEVPSLRIGPQLTVTSTAFQPDGAIPSHYSDYDKSLSFPLRWSAGPAGTLSYTVMIEDPDAAPATPIVHWLVWDIPPGMTSLPEGATPTLLPTVRMGTNTHHAVGYFGPHPPAGDPPHHYHAEVFALDRILDLPAGQTLEAVAKAMRGHVVAHGELIGTFAKAK